MRNYAFNVTLDISDMFKYNFISGLDKGWAIGEALWEEIINWETGVYYDTKYILDDTQDDAIAYLTKKGFTEKEIEEYQDELESDILRSVDQAIKDNWEIEIFKLIEDKANNPGFDYSALEFLDRKGNVTEYFYEANSIRYYFSKALWREVIFDNKTCCWGNGRYYQNDTIKNALDNAEDDLADYVSDNLEKIDTERYGEIDRIQNDWEYKHWLDLFREYNEVEGAILKDRKEKQGRIKAMIKNHVPICYRNNYLTGQSANC